MAFSVEREMDEVPMTSFPPVPNWIKLNVQHCPLEKELQQVCQII